MKRNVLSFFKSSVCARSFFVFGAAFLAILSISCKQLASFDPVVNGEQVVVGGGNSGGDTSSLEAAEFSFNLKATHGLMRKISLEWTAFSGAKYYEIYFAESASAEFTKIAETEQPFFDDAVAAGRTGYFKVCAVKANGASTPFSSTVVGTSLAVPIIGGGEVGDSKASISWFMENARGIDGTDYYEKTLKFEVVCQPKGESEGGETKVLSASSFSSTSYSYTFEELSSSKDYEFYVEAYLDSDTQSREKSPTVDKTTLTTYMPLAPKFSASEGDSAKGISLLITLPDMVTVSAFLQGSETPNIKQDVLFPLCFEVSRKHEKEEAYVKKATLYYDGTNLTTNPVEYQEGGAPYEVGAQVAWFDGDASLIGGQKYDYEIVSVPDINYSKVVCPEDKMFDNSENRRTPKEKTTTAQGWKSAPPAFNVKVAEDGGRKLSDDNSKVVSVSFGFSAEWNDLGKAGDYKFAIKQKRTLFDGGNGGEEYLKNGETIYFDTLDGIKALVKTFGSDSGLPKNEQGTYSYTLYVVSKNDNGTSDIENNENVLVSANAIDRMVVTEEVQLPKAELAVQGGYKDKVHYKFTCEQGVKYRLERTKMVDGSPTGEPLYIELNTTPASGPFEGYDTTVQGNCSYSYVLKAVAASGVPALSTAQTAETLGAPKVEFKLKIVDEKEELPYDSVTVSFDGVLAAKEYTVTLGAGGGFGGGKGCTFTADGTVTSGNAEVKFSANTYTVTINKPEGYNNARLAGNFVDAVVTAKSGVDNASGGVKVNVLGPALLDAKVNAAGTTGESISLTWNKVDGAKGYLIRRVMYADAAMNKIAEGSGITYYCDASGKNITANGDTGAVIRDSNEEVYRVTVDPSDTDFKLTDTYLEMNPKATSTENVSWQVYQTAQAKLAWGLPFRYVVLPVSKASDFDFDGLKLDSGEVAYTNLAPTAATAAWGYGLNLVADKATSGTTQNLEWEKPYNAQLPVVYYRKAGSTDEFTKFDDEGSSTGKKSIDMLKESRKNMLYGAYEYIVKYFPDATTASASVKPPLSLLAEINKNVQKYDTPQGEKTELDNKGYLLTLDGFGTKRSDENYYEEISWNFWDYDIRAVGPDSMTIRVQNNNIDAAFHDFVEITKVDAGTVKLADGVVDTTAKSKGSLTVNVAPAGIATGTKGTTDGMLKVLRDYKHYYTFTLKRGETTVAYEDYVGKENSIKTAYRQITDEELVRAATLAMSIGFERAWSKNSSDPWSRTKGDRNHSESSPGSGSIKYKTKSGVVWDYNPGTTLEYSSLCINLETKSKESLPMFVTISGTIKGDAPSYTAICPPEKYYGTLNVSSGIQIYNNASIEFDLKKNSGSIKVTRDGNSTSFGNITPLPFAGSSNPSYSFEGHNNDEEWQ